MQRNKLLVLVLVAMLVISFSFNEIALGATTTKKTTTQTQSKTVSKPVVHTTIAAKTTSKKPVVTKPVVKKQVTAKITSTKKQAPKKTVTKKKTSKKPVVTKRRRVASRGKVYSRGCGRTLGDGDPIKVINYAKRYLGVDYRFGSSSSRSFDCSGFTMYIYRAAGIDLPHSAAGQANLGLAVSSKGNLQPGDLVFFETYKAGISHVGMYIGNGHFIHASSGAGEVTVTSLSDPYYVQRYRGATRILK